MILSKLLILLDDFFFSTLGICTVIGFVFVEYEDFGEEILSVQKS